MVSQFSIGDRVKFFTHPRFCQIRLKGRRVSVQDWRDGTITKLHKSGSFGIAEIHPADGGRKVRRKLQHVKPA